MATSNEILVQHPESHARILGQLAGCVDACLECAQACTSCADACLATGEASALASCIRANLDCADIAGVTARLLSRQTETDWYLAISVLDTCIHACEICAEECDAHGERYAHCRTCAQACKESADACRRLMGELPQPTDVF
ncbi:MAG TPA: four-helix bundle copper-binding protein [Dehalococcoidia bacterium]|nr:four-helix bundle copper-binding protein [Dehalococcoidia bacterium]